MVRRAFLFLNLFIMERTNSEGTNVSVDTADMLVTTVDFQKLVEGHQLVPGQALLPENVAEVLQKVSREIASSIRASLDYVAAQNFGHVTFEDLRDACYPFSPEVQRVRGLVQSTT